VHVSEEIIRTQIKAEGNVNAKFIMNSNIKERIQAFNYTITDKSQILENLQKNYEKK
jgi:hypothetical protein